MVRLRLVCDACSIEAGRSHDGTFYTKVFPSAEAIPWPEIKSARRKHTRRHWHFGTVFLYVGEETTDATQ